jgi:hypothetical protein
LKRPSLVAFIATGRSGPPAPKIHHRLQHVFALHLCITARRVVDPDVRFDHIGDVKKSARDEREQSAAIADRIADREAQGDFVRKCSCEWKSPHLFGADADGHDPPAFAAEAECRA